MSIPRKLRARRRRKRFSGKAHRAFAAHRAKRGGK